MTSLSDVTPPYLSLHFTGVPTSLSDVTPLGLDMSYFCNIHVQHIYDDQAKVPVETKLWASLGPLWFFLTGWWTSKDASLSDVLTYLDIVNNKIITLFIIMHRLHNTIYTPITAWHVVIYSFTGKFKCTTKNLVYMTYWDSLCTRLLNCIDSTLTSSSDDDGLLSEMWDTFLLGKELYIHIFGIY